MFGMNVFRVFVSLTGMYRTLFFSYSPSYPEWAYITYAIRDRFVSLQTKGDQI